MTLTEDAPPSTGSTAGGQPAVVPRLWTPPADLAARHERWLLPIRLRGALVASGMTDKAIRGLCEGGELARLRWGSYTDGVAYAALDDVGRHAVQSRAVLHRSGTGASLSHGSALVWYDVPDWGLDLTDVNTTRHDGRTGRREAGVAQHRGQIVDGDVLQLHDLTLMSPCRAALEHTMTAGVESGLVHVNHLLHTGLTTREELRARYESMVDWPGSLRTEVVLRLADSRIETVLETRFFHLCWRNSIPLPVPQYVVEDGSGTVVARLDFTWPRLGKWVECDGKVKYEKLLKPGQRASDVVLREKEREKLVRRLTGMECDRYTWGDVENERRTVARLREFLFGDGA